jgi:hypothetical protein
MWTMSRGATVLATLSSMLVLGACGSRWTSLGSDEAGGFVIDMPGETLCGAAGGELSEARLVGRSCSVDSTGQVPVHFYASYSVSWFDLPRRLDEGGRGALLREHASRLAHAGRGLGERRAELGGNEGLEVQISLSSDSVREDRAICERVLECIHGGRLYDISVVYLQSRGSRQCDGDGATERTWRRMVDSFHFGMPGSGVRKVAMPVNDGRSRRAIPRPAWATGPSFATPAPVTPQYRKTG